jgi:hypothetical protein
MGDCSLYSTVHHPVCYWNFQRQSNLVEVGIQIQTLSIISQTK